MEALTRTETKNLERCEKVISTGIRQFFQVGQALWDIRDARLYRATHETFEAYCEDRWDYSKSRAYQLITAAEVSAEISTIVDVEPDRESHIRPLLSIDKEHRAEVWQLAVDTAPRDDAGKPRMSARHVEATVEAWQANQRQETPETPEEPAENEDEPDVIDVDSKPVSGTIAETDDLDDYDDEDDDESGECPVDDGQLEDNQAMDAVEDLMRDVFRDRLVIAAARLETLAEKLRSDA